MVSKTDKILNKIRKDNRQFEPKNPIASDMFLPNHSGDLSAGRVNTTPTTDQQPVNKKYVDDQFPVTHVSTTGQTTDDHHAETHTIVSHDTDTTGAELTSLADNSMVDTLHRHSELSASDGSPDAVVQVSAGGAVQSTENITILKANAKLTLDGSSGDPTFVIDSSPAQNRSINFITDGSLRWVLKADSTAESGSNAGTNLQLVSRTDAGGGLRTNLIIDRASGDWGIIGNVGIGTDAPRSTLTVLDQIDALRVLGRNDLKIGGFNQNSYMEFDDNGNIWIISSLGNVGIGTTSPTLKFSVSEKTGMSPLGGICIKLTNKTGANSVAGQLVQADTSQNDAVKLTSVDEEETIGVFLDAGVSDGSEAWIVISGIADVAMEDNTTATRGNWVRTSATIGEEGYADATNSAPPSPAAFSHFNEIGNCIETVTAGGEGTHILARCVLHFN